MTTSHDEEGRGPCPGKPLSKAGRQARQARWPLQGLGLGTRHLCYAQDDVVRHLGSSQQLLNEKELLSKKENHQLQKVNSQVPKIGADKSTESLFKVSLRSHAAAVGRYAVSRKNCSDGKICYSCSPPGRKRGNFLALGGFLLS